MKVSQATANISVKGNFCHEWILKERFNWTQEKHRLFDKLIKVFVSKAMHV